MSQLIPLERVVFRDGVQVPGTTAKSAGVPQYPTTEKMVSSYERPTGQLAKQRFELYFDRTLGVVQVIHPVSREVEEVPFANVVQWRRKAEEPKPAPPKDAKP